MASPKNAKLPSRPAQVLNLDAVIAATPERFIEFAGSRHPVRELNTEVGLQMTALVTQVQEAAAANNYQVLAEANVDLLILLAPTLEPIKADLKALPIPLLQQLVEFVMATAEEATELVRKNEAAIAAATGGTSGE
jgi:hypothetical protein